jgi:hypothetical protein
MTMSSVEDGNAARKIHKAPPLNIPQLGVLGPLNEHVGSG